MLALSVIKAELREGPYAWPGGYPKYFLCADGEVISYAAAHENRREIMAAHLYARKHDVRSDGQWILVGYDVNWEDPDLFCAHTGKRIPSAYAGDRE